MTVILLKFENLSVPVIRLICGCIPFRRRDFEPTNQKVEDLTSVLIRVIRGDLRLVRFHAEFILIRLANRGDPDFKNPPAGQNPIANSAMIRADPFPLERRGLL